MRRYMGHMNGEKYLGNSYDLEVHDLDGEPLRIRGTKVLYGQTAWVGSCAYFAIVARKPEL